MDAEAVAIVWNEAHREHSDWEYAQQVKAEATARLKELIETDAYAENTRHRQVEEMSRAYCKAFWASQIS